MDFSFSCWNSDLRIAVMLFFAVVFMGTPVIILTRAANKYETSQQKEFLLNRYVRSRREKSFNKISSSGSFKIFSVAASKALHSVRLSMRQLRAVLLTVFFAEGKRGMPLTQGSTVFQIVPCNHYFLRIGVLLI